MRTVTVRQMQELDRHAIEIMGIPASVLMEAAGAGAARIIIERVSSLALARGVLVIAGTGNNGGDGYVVARHLAAHGLVVEIVRARPPRTAEARLHHDICERMAIPMIDLAAPATWPPAGCIVDALLGIGIEGELRADAVDAIAAINARGPRVPGHAATNLHSPAQLDDGRPSPAFIVALDTPSGLDADRGTTTGACVRAQLTVTFGAIKQGLTLEPARPQVGELHLVEIGLPGLARQPE